MHKLSEPQSVSISISGNQVALIITHTAEKDEIGFVVATVPDTLVPDHICALANVARRFHNDPSKIIREANEYRFYYNNKYPQPFSDLIGKSDRSEDSKVVQIKAIE